jgi:hypothetical protein
MKDLRGRTIIMIIVFLGIKKFWEQNTSSNFPSNHLDSLKFFTLRNIFDIVRSWNSRQLFKVIACIGTKCLKPFNFLVTL